MTIIIPSLNDAAVYGGGFPATPMNLCKNPPEGLKCVPIQISFLTGLKFLINISAAPAPPISQIASIFINAEACVNSITIFFSDTGYSLTIPPGGSRLVPVLTGVLLPRFYVINNDSVNANNSDSVVLHLINQFIPEYTSDLILVVKNFGFSAKGIFNAGAGLFNSNGIARQDINFNQSCSTIPQGFVGFPVTIYNNDDWYITDIFFQAAVYTDNATTQLGFFELWDGGAGLFVVTIPFVVKPNGGAAPGDNLLICNMTGLKYRSDGSGHLFYNLAGLTAHAIVVGAPIIMGGIIS